MTVSRFWSRRAGGLYRGCTVIGKHRRRASAASLDGKPRRPASARRPPARRRRYIGNLLGEAEAAGWIRIAGGRLTAVDPTLLAEFEAWAAGQMLFYDDLAAAILAASPAAAVPGHAS